MSVGMAVTNNFEPRVEPPDFEDMTQVRIEQEQQIRRQNLKNMRQKGETGPEYKILKSIYNKARHYLASLHKQNYNRKRKNKEKTEQQENLFGPIGGWQWD